MSGFWKFLVIGVVVVIIIGIILNEQEKTKARQEYIQKENEKRYKEAAMQREREQKNKEKLVKLKWEVKNKIGRFDRKYDSVKNYKLSAINSIKNFLSESYEISKNYTYAYEIIKNFVECMEEDIDEMNDIIAEIKDANYTIINLEGVESYTEAINQFEKKIKEPKMDVVELKNTAEELKTFGERLDSVSYCKMIDISDYGKIRKDYWDSIRSLNRTEVVNFISECERKLGSTQFDEIFKLDFETVLDAVWFFATENPFSARDFSKAVDLFERIYKRQHHDVFIADLYSKKQVGGEEAIREPIRELLKGKEHEFLYKYFPRIIASSLMWMNAYRLEADVLKYMLTNGMEMDAKVQQRLHSLTNGGGNAPEGFEVASSAKTLYFDLSALAWKESEYIGLFENLSFQDKTLNYSLAVREENKDLLVPNKINISDKKYILDSFNVEFEEEYGADVTAWIADCSALSGSGEEKIDGIVVTSNECKQMSILIHIAKIGKKLNIKFYTLFVPDGDDMAVQKQQALSMYNRLSPTVTMWETSLKDTMLRAVEKILNCNEVHQSGNGCDGVNSTQTVVF